VNFDKLLFPMLLGVVLMAGCNSNLTRQDSGPPSDVSSAEQSVSTQTATTDVRQRAKVHTELGLIYLQDNRPTVALEEAKIALDAESGYAPAYNLLGLIYMQLRQNDQAESNFRRALSLASGDPEINTNYGWFLCQTGRVNESFAYFNLALRNPLYQTPAKALSNAGVCYMMNKDDLNGESYLFRSLKLDPTNLRAYYLLADISYRAKRYEDARDWLKQLHTQIEPTSETAWLALKIDRKLGNRDGEANNTAILRRKYRDTTEYQQMLRGEFD
jgi:type IV pilus assembly protein PilF